MTKPTTTDVINGLSGGSRSFHKGLIVCPWCAFSARREWLIEWIDAYKATASCAKERGDTHAVKLLHTRLGEMVSKNYDIVTETFYSSP